MQMLSIRVHFVVHGQQFQAIVSTCLQVSYEDQLPLLIQRVIAPAARAHPPLAVPASRKVSNSARRATHHTTKIERATGASHVPKGVTSPIIISMGESAYRVALLASGPMRPGYCLTTSVKVAVLLAGGLMRLD